MEGGAWEKDIEKSEPAKGPRHQTQDPIDEVATFEKETNTGPTQTLQSNSLAPPPLRRDFSDQPARTANEGLPLTPPSLRHGISDLPTPQPEAEEEKEPVDDTFPPLRRNYTKLANKEAHPWEHWGITLGLPAILLFDIVVPCIIYYTWYDTQKAKWQHQCRNYPKPRGETCPIPKPEYDKDILGYAIISFGAGELWILIARTWRLFRHREQCAPLLSRNRWELDATSWVYGVAMILALIPFVVGSSLVMPKLYLYSPSFIMGFLGILMLFTSLHPFNFKLPIGINSQARGSVLRPFIYYAAEDFIAVDGLQDREFRVRYNERYESSEAFRQMFVHLTMWWELGVCVYIGCVSAVIWTVEFHIAFGLSLGVLFAYIAVWAAGTYVWVTVSMKRQEKLSEENKGYV